MINNIAFIFKHAPYGTTKSKDGLNLLVSTLSFTNKVGVFFIDNGILLLLKNKRPIQISLSDFTITFNILILYKIKSLYACVNSAKNLGLSDNTRLIFNVNWVNKEQWRENLNNFNCILTF